MSFMIGGEGGIRTHGTLARTPIFKTGALNQLDHLSSRLLNKYSTCKFNCQELFDILFHIFVTINSPKFTINTGLFFIQNNWQSFHQMLNL